MGQPLPPQLLGRGASSSHQRPPSPVVPHCAPHTSSGYSQGLQSLAWRTGTGQWVEPPLAQHTPKIRGWQQGGVGAVRAEDGVRLGGGSSWQVRLGSAEAQQLLLSREAWGRHWAPAGLGHWHPCWSLCSSQRPHIRTKRPGGFGEEAWRQACSPGS